MSSDFLKILDTDGEPIPKPPEPKLEVILRKHDPDAPDVRVVFRTIHKARIADE